MLSNARLEKDMWAEAISIACYLVNRSPSTTIDYKISEEVWTGHSVDYSNLRVFGCHAFAYVSKN